MIYINAAELLELIVGRTEEEFCNLAGVSKQACYRLFHHGGPVMVSTLMKIANALGVAPASLVDRQRTPNHYVRVLIGT